MLITEKNIDKALTYLENLRDKDFEKLVDKLLDEQALLSTFVQQNLDNFFPNDEQIKDFAYNLYFSILYVFKNKLSKNYYIIDEKKLNEILSKKNKEHKQEELGDFIFTQLVESDFSKDDFMKVLGLLNIVISCFDI